MLIFVRVVLFLISLCFVPFAMSTTLMAVTEFELEISAGTFISVRSAGNAQSQWLEVVRGLDTPAGQAIVKRSGIWYLAQINSQQQALSTGVPLVAGDVKPAEILFPQSFNSEYDSSNTESHKGFGLGSIIANDGAANKMAVQSFALSATSESVQQPILLLRVSFLDQDFSYSVESFQQLMFAAEGSQVLSVAQYYRDNSYQKFQLQPAAESHGRLNDGIVDIFLPYNHPNFGSNYGSPSQNLVRDALQEANKNIDFSQFDSNHDNQLSPRELGVVLMIAGHENAYGGAGAAEPNIWAHKSELAGLVLDGVGLSGYAMFGEKHQDHLATIGIMSHEMAHLLFSLPDLYDRQGDSNGIGRWGLMGLGSWNTDRGESGSSPAHMLAWSKAKAGFIYPQDIEGSEVEFSLSSTTHHNEAMRVWLDPFRHGEHFLLEYRIREGFDRGLPGEGLLISHVDDWVGYGARGAQNDVEEHKLVDIEEADGRSDLDLLENRGDRSDVYNDAYGQDYFGSSSLPASFDYHGNSSGLEISQIEVSDKVRGNLTLPYSQLGNNLGYDDGGIGTSWGGRGESSLVQYAFPSGMDYVHGVDVFSHTEVIMNANIYSSFLGGVVSNELYVSVPATLTPGWNRIQFSEPVDVSQFLNIYLELKANKAGAFSIDTVGEVSQRSFVKSSKGYQPAGFDFNQRLLIAAQAEVFNYQVPDKLPLADSDQEKSSGGGSGLAFILLLIFSFVRTKLGVVAKSGL
jgi:immune inhibitor A